MKAKLFDAHNKFLSDHEIAEASPTIELREFDATKSFDSQPRPQFKTFRLVDTDEAGSLIYRRIED